MLKIGDKEYRNLEEQVLKNKSDIESIVNEQGTLNQFGIKVVGEVVDASELPASGDEYGDAYAVGTDTPYELYVWTRANTIHPNDYWFNIGEFPLPGPQGPVGPTGPQGEKGERGVQGPQGVQGIQGIAGPQGNTGPQGAQGVQGQKGDKGDPGEGFRVVDTLSNVNQLPTPTADIQNEAYLVTIDGAYHLYLITGTAPNLLWTDCGRIEGVQGPQGPQGIQGPQGETGATGPQGEQGIQGIQGVQGPQGNTGATGNGIASITTDSGTAVTGGIQYVMTITYTNGTTATQTFIAKDGTDGTSAGFGTPTASATTVTGNPTVSVTASGPDTAKVFSFAFGIPKAEPATTTLISFNEASLVTASSIVTNVTGWPGKVSNLDMVKYYQLTVNKTITLTAGKKYSLRIKYVDSGVTTYIANYEGYIEQTAFTGGSMWPLYGNFNTTTGTYTNYLSTAVINPFMGLKIQCGLPTDAADVTATYTTNSKIRIELIQYD